jgi:hypothetical protein
VRSADRGAVAGAREVNDGLRALFLPQLKWTLILGPGVKLENGRSV